MRKGTEGQPEWVRTVGACAGVLILVYLVVSMGIHFFQREERREPSDTITQVKLGVWDDLPFLLLANHEDSLTDVKVTVRVRFKSGKGEAESQQVWETWQSGERKRIEIKESGKAVDTASVRGTAMRDGREVRIEVESECLHLGAQR